MFNIDKTVFFGEKRFEKSLLFCFFKVQNKCHAVVKGFCNAVAFRVQYREMFKWFRGEWPDGFEMTGTQMVYCLQLRSAGDRLCLQETFSLEADGLRQQKTTPALPQQSKPPGRHHQLVT